MLRCTTSRSTKMEFLLVRITSFVASGGDVPFLDGSGEVMRPLM